MWISTFPSTICLRDSPCPIVYSWLPCWQPCVNRRKPEENLVEVLSGPDVKIGCLTWVLGKHVVAASLWSFPQAIWNSGASTHAVLSGKVDDKRCWGQNDLGQFSNFKWIRSSALRHNASWRGKKETKQQKKSNKQNNQRSKKEEKIKEGISEVCIQKKVNKENTCRKQAHKMIAN